MMRLFSLFALVLAAFAFWNDFVASGAALQMTSFAEYWASIHLGSLIGFQSGLENRISQDAFLDYALPVLELPAALTLCAVGAILMFLSLSRARA